MVMEGKAAAAAAAAPPPEYQEVDEQELNNVELTEHDGLPSDIVIQAEAAIQGHAADLPSHPRRAPSEEGTATGSHDSTRLSTIDSFYQYHSGLDEASLADEGENVPPPAYSDEWGTIHQEEGGMGTNAQVASDGRVNIRIDQRSRKLSSFLVPALRTQLRSIQEAGPPPPPYIPESLGGLPGVPLPPPLNIVIHVVGSRGDVQPFVALGQVLKNSFGHRVRLATHPTFKGFVEENGLEFFNIGGDPSELMAFMVKNPGLMPGFDAIRKGDIGKRRQGIAEMIKGCWRSCFEIGDGMGPASNDTTLRSTNGQELKTAYMHAGSGRPFIADAIIANPPSFAHIHCAERLGIPLHMMFTMPWSPTQSFPHPLANIQSSDADQSLTNFMSYALVDMLTWQGLGDLINRFRVHSLQLEPISLMWAPGMLARLRIPYTYCWSPALIPKPKDWGPNIAISGFYFLNLATNYEPAPDLKAFLEAGPPPVYIGFGSIVVEDPNALTEMIFNAVRKSGVRALVSKGWGGFGADELDIPEGVFMLGNVPHDWLFQHVSCVVHHGGAGTTAAGIKAGKPTVIVPFFGDQPFWGAMVARAGAGPEPIHHKSLDANNLAEAIQYCLKPESQQKAKSMADEIAHEHGNETGAETFHQLMPGGIDRMRCSVVPDRAAVWRVKRTQIRLSALTACVLAEEGILSFSDLKLYRPQEYETDEGPWDPISGGAGSIVGTFSSMMMGVADLPIETLKALKIHPDAARKKKSSGTGSASEAGASNTSLAVDNPASGSASPLRESSDTGTGRAELPATESTTSLGQDSLYRDRTPSIGSPLSPSGTNNSVRRKPVGSTGSVNSLVQQFESNTIYSEPSGLVSPLAESSNAVSSRATTAMTDVTPVASPIARDSSKLTIPEHRSSMAEALSGNNRSRSGSGSSSLSRPTSRGTESPSSKSGRAKQWLQNDYENNKQAKLDTLLGTGKGFSKIIGSGLKSPMDFSLALAKGFHNMPKLYGDETVREVEKVTDIQSGIKVAAKEFGFGMYDGITGLVSQPLRGARKEGAAGFIKGVGKGIAGVVVKPGAGIYGIPGYTMKGVYQEVQKHFGASVNNYIIGSRTAQGYEDFRNTSPEERKAIATRYLQVRAEWKTGKQKFDDRIDAKYSEWKDERARRRSESSKKGKQRSNTISTTSSACPSERLKQWTQELAQHHRTQYQYESPNPLATPLQHISTEPATMNSSSNTGTAVNPVELPTPIEPPHAELASEKQLQTPRRPTPHHAYTFPRPTTSNSATERDVHSAVAENQHEEHYLDEIADLDEQDRTDLEAAIRMSVQQTSRGDEQEDELIANAIRASVVELERGVQQHRNYEDNVKAAVRASAEEAARRHPHEGVSEEEYERQIEEVLQRSMKEQRRIAVKEGRLPDRVKSSDSEWDSSEEGERAMTPEPDSEEELQRAIEESKKDPPIGVPHDNDDDENEQLRKAMEESAKQLVPEADPEAQEQEAEQLRRAMEESLSASTKEQEDEAKRKREEEIVLEYVKKQSLMEEELRRKRLQGLGDGGGGDQQGESSTG